MALHRQSFITTASSPKLHRSTKASSIYQGFTDLPKLHHHSFTDLPQLHRSTTASPIYHSFIMVGVPQTKKCAKYHPQMRQRIIAIVLKLPIGHVSVHIRQQIHIYSARNRYRTTNLMLQALMGLKINHKSPRGKSSG
jgi:hypothetical protein